MNIYENLEKSMLGIDDYKLIPVVDTREPLVPIMALPNLSATQRGVDMLPYTGDVVYVRKGVYARLCSAAKLLCTIDPLLTLDVTYGYRALEVQTKNFKRARQRFVGKLDENELDRAAHRLVARPDVAGHPAGAAVDIRIVSNGESVDFGTQVGEFVPDSYTFSPCITPDAMRNRMLLRSVMMSVGFAPFDGEWWHFSYGDKEWAAYVGSRVALYDQLNFNSIMLAK